MNTELLGKGLYPIPMAARLVELSDDLVRRWVRAYADLDATNTTKQLVWKPEVYTINGKRHITFKDLVELRIIAIFKRYKISNKHLAQLSQILSAYLNADYPLTTARFSTDGKELFVNNDEECVRIYNILTNQYSFLNTLQLEKDVVKIQKHAGGFQGFINDYNQIVDKEILFQDNQPVEWCKWDDICMNPDKFAGLPSIKNIPTETLYHQYNAHKDYAYVGSLYGIDPQTVQKAVKFEQGILH